MESANAAQVREIYEIYSRRDWPRFDDLVVENFEWIPNEIDPEHATRQGREEIKRAIEELFEAFETLETDVEELTENGDKVLALVHHVARGSASGAEIERREAHLWTFRDGRPVALHEFADAGEARTALES